MGSYTDGTSDSAGGGGDTFKTLVVSPDGKPDRCQ